ncbi:cytochrome P450 26A1-like [Gigantopelta aegis]|uniref:cytochrome P450 26A1-like n=1 Tax=Gigantopelta aegis TaxID=1735272 RepID=UPI001B88AAAA|nr:cytochrome P450 26A1-like [Gigantopelta aegis]
MVSLLITRKASVILYNESHTHVRLSPEFPLTMEYASVLWRLEESILLRNVVVSSIILSLLLLISYHLWYLYNVSCRDQSCKLPLPPGTMGLPIIGETLNLLLMGAHFYKKRIKSYGNVFKTHLLGNPTIRVVGAKNIRKIILGEGTLVTGYWPKSVRMLMGEGTITHSVGESHRTRRKAILKAFSHDALSSYVPAIQRIVKTYIGNWCRQGYVFGFPECKSLTFSLASQVLVGFHLTENEHKELVRVFHQYVNCLFSLPVNVPGSGLYRGMHARHRLMQTIEECIMKKTSSKDDQTCVDVVTLMMAMVDNDELSQQEVKDVALELLFAGHATCASASSSMLLQLAKNQHVVDRILEELGEHGLEGDEDEGESLTYEAIGKLKYLSHVVKEVLRVSPPIGAGFRKALQTFEVDGFQIPKGWTVVFSIRETQENADLFNNGQQFDPDRWETIKDERFNYLPFGGGRRSCPGQEFAKLVLKIFAIELSRNCTWKLLNESAQMRYMPVPHPVDGLPVEFSQLTTKTNRTRASTV